MFNLLHLFNNVLLTVDIYDETANQGDSIWPFISFVLFAIGIMLVFIGVVKLSTAKREWSLFYDRRDSVAKSDKVSKNKSVKVAWATIAIGLIVFIASFFIK